MQALNQHHPRWLSFFSLTPAEIHEFWTHHVMLGLGMPEISQVNSTSCPSVTVSGSRCLTILGTSVTAGERERVISAQSILPQFNQSTNTYVFF